MKKLMFLCLVLALFSMQSYAYTIFEASQDLGSENTYYEYFSSTPSYVSVSVDAWNSNTITTAFKDSVNIFAKVQLYRNGSLQRRLSNHGDGSEEHVYHESWTSVQQGDQLVVTLINNYTSGSGQCWARIDYFY